MGLLAFVLALASGSVHRKLLMDNKAGMIAEITKIQVHDLFDYDRERAKELGLALQGSETFRQAFHDRNKQQMILLLNEQFHQYFVTADVIKLEKLIVFDRDFHLLAHSSEGMLGSHKLDSSVCAGFVNQARSRKGNDRIKILKGDCDLDNKVYNAVILPVGGLRLKGYILVLTNPVHSLLPLEKSLGAPIKITGLDKNPYYVSSKWPKAYSEENVYIVDMPIIKGNQNALLSISIAYDISELSENLSRTRFNVLLVTILVTGVIVFLVLMLIRKTTIKPLDRLNNSLRQFHLNKAKIGHQAKVKGAIEIQDLTRGFNEMSAELAQLYAELESMAYTDALTKLPNRNLFHHNLEIQLNRYRSKGIKFALFILDLDRFKAVNDALGHHIGDELLQEVSKRLQNILRDNDYITRIDKESTELFKEDMIARLGGDEFAAIFPGMENTNNAIVVARKLLHEMKHPFFVGEHRFSIGLSIGIVLCPQHGDDMNTLVRRADVAMYQAKQEKIGFSIYDNKQDADSLHVLQLEQDQFSAISNGEFELYYQPKIDIRSSQIVGAEALLRWIHPTKGMIPPDQFIPIAEQNGFIHTITEWVLDQACRDFSVPIAGHEMTIAVNLSALNLQDRSISHSIANVLSLHNMPASRLVLELTEGSIMADPDFAIQILKVLDEMGVNISIDDFGTGYSSLAYLKKLPVDEIKIDRSFINELIRDANDAAIIDAVLVLANKMNLSVVAEGVEDKQTIDVLMQLGCGQAQGYYIAKPMPLEEFKSWLAQWHQQALPQVTQGQR